MSIHKKVKEQRIYFGGIDPTRGLSVDQVLSRLRTRLGDDTTIQTQDVHKGDCYFQFTAISTNDNDEPPLQKIKSWFHNVVWKGCKLTVDEARPHFLERLKDERRQAADSRAQETTPEASTTAVLTARRHWKVKRGFSGKPMEIVDTQPCRVRNWSELSRIRQRHNLQYEKQRRNRPVTPRKSLPVDAVTARKLSYYNRSIHLVFSEDSNDDNSLSLTQDASSRDDDDDASSTRASSSPGSSCEKEAANRGEAKYAWSSDEEDDNDSGAQNATQEGDDSISSESLGVNAEPTIQARSSSSSSVDDKRNSLEYEDMGKPTLQAMKATTGKYSWSDDDSSSADETTRSDHQRPHNTHGGDMDEFAAALDETVFDSDDNNIVEAAAGTVDSGHDNLQHDVESNLQILAQLFPEISIPAESTTKADGEERKSVTATTAAGWGARGQMLRFDPTNPQTAKQFVLSQKSTAATSEKDSAREEGDAHGAELSSDDSTSSSLMASSETFPAKKDKVTASLNQHSLEDDVYEQGKLERVFKQARQSTVVEAEPASFSFGFDLKDDKAAHEPPPSNSFSFSFPLAGEANTVKAPDTAQQNDVDAVVAAICQDSPPQSRRRRHRAFEFPENDDLDSYVHRFYYKLNDGERIINDLEGWRNDPAVKERWLKERSKLTADWKGKRKYALSKKKRRFR